MTDFGRRNSAGHLVVTQDFAMNPMVTSVDGASVGELERSSWRPSRSWLAGNEGPACTNTLGDSARHLLLPDHDFEHVLSRARFDRKAIVFGHECCHDAIFRH